MIGWQMRKVRPFPGLARSGEIRVGSSDCFDRRAIPGLASESLWHAGDGQAIRRIDWPGEGASARGSILFLPGRADFYEKYLETLDHWHKQGWRVTALDWRWQAGSGRFGADPRIGDVDDFATWVEDLAAFWAHWTETTPGPHILAGHSMGGHLVLRALAEARVSPAALVLSAPMLGFVTPIPEGLQTVFGWLMCRLGDPGRMAWKNSEKPGTSADARASLLTHDAARYADELWWRKARPALDLGPASWRWVAKAATSMARIRREGLLEKVTTPVLIVATRADALVAWPAIERAARRLPHAQLAVWGEEAHHELLREIDPVRDRVLATIDAFLDSAVHDRDI